MSTPNKKERNVIYKHAILQNYIIQRLEKESWRKLAVIFPIQNQVRFTINLTSNGESYNSDTFIGVAWEQTKDSKGDGGVSQTHIWRHNQQTMSVMTGRRNNFFLHAGFKTSIRNIAKNILRDCLITFLMQRIFMRTSRRTSNLPRNCQENHKKVVNFKCQ